MSESSRFLWSIDTCLLLFSLQNVMVKKHALELTTSFIIPLVSCEYLLAHRFVAVTELVILLLSATGEVSG